MKAPSPTYKKNLPEAGSYIARVVGLIYLGTQVTKFGDKYKIRLTWELATELAIFKEGEPEKPYTVSKEFGFSMGKKSTLRPFVEGIIGVALTDEEAYAFDIEKILTKTCILSITIDEGENGKYVSIKSTAPLMKGQVCPPQINATKVLSFENWDETYFSTLPEFITSKVKASKEYIDMMGKNGVDVISPDQIPF